MAKGMLKRTLWRVVSTTGLRRPKDMSRVSVHLGKWCCCNLVYLRLQPFPRPDAFNSSLGGTPYSQEQKNKFKKAANVFFWYDRCKTLEWSIRSAQKLRLELGLWENETHKACHILGLMMSDDLMIWCAWAVQHFLTSMHLRDFALPSLNPISFTSIHASQEHFEFQCIDGQALQ